MGNFSRDPLQELRRERAKGYVGLHIEQGVPVLDRDLNLLAGLVSSSVREILARYLGGGIAERGDGFAIEAIPAENDFRVCAPPDGGACLVGGIEVTIERPLRYTEQSVAAPLTTPDYVDREDVVYLDVWVEEVDASADPVLANAADVDMQTSVRLRPAWSVRVAEGTRHPPAPALGHAHQPLAMLERRRGVALVPARAIVDLRPTGLNLADLARRVQRIEDVLFSYDAPEAMERPAAGRASDAIKVPEAVEPPQVVAGLVTRMEPTP